MANKIKLPRGLKANMPRLDEGEVAFASDEKKVYVGTADGNEAMPKIHISAAEPANWNTGDLWFKVPTV